MRETPAAARSGVPAATAAMQPGGRRTGQRRSAWAMLPMLLVGGAAGAQDMAGDPSRGRTLAEHWCVECHEVAPDNRASSAVAIARPEDPGELVVVEAPAFQAAADDPAATEAALRVFLQTPHANMPNLRLSVEQTDDVIAYILSLKGSRPGT